MSSNSSAGGFAPADWLMSAFKQNPEGSLLLAPECLRASLEPLIRRVNMPQTLGRHSAKQQEAARRPRANMRRKHARRPWINLDGWVEQTQSIVRE
jgi:hypothetical protein